SRSGRVFRPIFLQVQRLGQNRRSTRNSGLSTDNSRFAAPSVTIPGKPTQRRGAASAFSSSKSRALVGVHVLSLAFMRSGGMEKVARDCKKTCQEGKRT